MKYILILPSCAVLDSFFLAESKELKHGTFYLIEDFPMTAEEIGQEMGGN